MKGIYLVAVATIAFAVSWTVITANGDFDTIPTECPAKDPNDTTVHLPHESDCTKYYMCLGGRKIVQQCPYRNEKGDRLHFNPRKQACDWPEAAGCEHKDFEQHQAESTNERSIPEQESHEPVVMTQVYTNCPAVNPDPMHVTIHIAHETDCTKFYTCPLRVVRDCPYMNKLGDRLHFNPRLMVCDWPDQAGCAIRYFKQDEHESTNEQSLSEEKSHKMNVVMDEIPTKCPAKDPKDTTVHLPHESDCTKYYMCLAGRKILLQCPYRNENSDRLHFNARKQACDWPATAGCETEK